jgi:hypothetical protein
MKRNQNHNIDTKSFKTLVFQIYKMGQNQKMNVCCMWVMIIVPFPTIIIKEQSLFTNQNSNPNLTISNHVKSMVFFFFKFKNKDRKRIKPVSAVIGCKQ